VIGGIMARETAAANEAALDLLDLQGDDRVLEVGFGHGATIARAAAVVSRGVVVGVDPSAEMCRMAARRNRTAIATGRVRLHQASVEALPLSDAEFDKVFSVHTVYFWPDLPAALTEIRRVLKPRGRMVLGWRDDPRAARSFPESVYRFPDEAAVRQAFESAGYGSLRVVRRPAGSVVLEFAIAAPEKHVLAKN
jgi:ubiquinone/menaquinone biosynthesis C-methylase UbiE